MRSPNLLLLFSVFYWHRTVMIFWSLHPFFSPSVDDFSSNASISNNTAAICLHAPSALTRGKYWIIKIIKTKKNSIRFHSFKFDFTYWKHFKVPKIASQKLHVHALKGMYNKQTSHQHASFKCRAIIYKNFHLNMFCLFW